LPASASSSPRGGGLVGIDLDDGIDPETSALKPWAAALLARLDSYAEVSPSGTGLKVWVRGTKPGTGWCKEPFADGEVEMYDRGRFFTVTGLRWPDTPATIQDRQQAVDDLYREVLAAKQARRGQRHHAGNGECAKGEGPFRVKPPSVAGPLTDDQIVRKAGRAANGDKFRRLMAGHTGDYDGDDSNADSGLCCLLAFYTKDPAQIDRIFRTSGLMRDKWDERRGDSTYGERTIARALEVVTEQWTPRSRRRAAGRHAAGEEEQAGARRRTSPTRGTAPAWCACTARICGTATRGASGWPGAAGAGAWTTGARLSAAPSPCPRSCMTGRWRRSPRSERGLTTRGKTMSRKKLSKKARLQQTQRILRWAVECESAARINAMLDLARSEPGIPVLPEDVDRDPWLFIVANGTLDLRTGELRQHRREDLLTMLCPTPYRPDAPCPTWERFPGAVFPDDEGEPDRQLITFVQRTFGRCLTGDVSEQILPIFWGGGANGKSTLVNAVLETLGGDYAMKANADLLMASRGERHPTELAQLFGMRLVVASETHQGRRLNEALVKDLTGGEPIRARRMREDFWEFPPTHKTILITNHRPRVTGTDEGIWRRLRLVPFTATFWDPNDPGKDPAQLPQSHRQDKQLGQKLAAEREGILAWLVRGCRDWRRDGLTLPGQVKVATAEYRSGEDMVAQWIAECCLTGCDDYRRRASDLLANYRQWCERTGEEPVGQKSFGEALLGRGFHCYTSNGVW
jgi:putative DNA primase/helicase